MNWASVLSGLFGALAGYTLAVALRALWVWWREPRKPDFPPADRVYPNNEFIGRLLSPGLEQISGEENTPGPPYFLHVNNDGYDRPGWFRSDDRITWTRLDGAPTMADECEAVRKEEEAEIGRGLERKLRAENARMQGNGNVVHVTAYSRQKQTRKPKGTPK